MNQAANKRHHNQQSNITCNPKDQRLANLKFLTTRNSLTIVINTTLNPEISQYSIKPADVHKGNQIVANRTVYILTGRIPGIPRTSSGIRPLGF